MAYATNSLGNYSGTIIVSPIRPANPSSNIATVFSNEIKGSHHTYETVAERDAIIESRRDWGMLCTIYNDPTPSNNKTFVLKYGFVNNTITDNDNWIEFVTTGANFVPTGGEWINSVQIVSATPSILTDGYRYLVDSGGVGYFLGQDGKIAQYNTIATTFSFVEPTDGTTLRNDSEPNIVYKYQGTYSSGKWVKEYLNQVRYLNAYSIDGMSYSATSSQTPLTNYSDSVYYVNFNMTSSGTVSINIDSVGLINVNKLENNTLSSISANEIVPGIQYQLLYNSVVFQTVLPSSSTTTIGAAEDGDYTDGVFTDFTPSTPIGTAIDRFNELFRYLVPPMSPTFSSWSATGSFVNGGLSFDATVGGFSSATGSPYGSVGKGGTFSSNSNYYRLGIMSKVLQPVTGTAFYSDISGVFNINVPSSYAYATYSFGYGDVGTISLFLNGVTISSVGLTSGAAVDTTSGGATSGINLSASSPSLFTNGLSFPLYQNRTGVYLIRKDNPNILDGYNYFIAKHDIATSSYILSQFEFVADGSTQSVVPTTNTITNVQYGPFKFLSGIQYWDSPFRVEYNTTLQNVFSNTFNQSPIAISFKDLTLDVSGVTNSVTGTRTISDPTTLFSGYLSSLTQSITPTGGFVPSSPLPLGLTFAANSKIRRINERIAFGVDVLKTVQGTYSGTASSGGTWPNNNWFIDTYPVISTLGVEYFVDEQYRKTNGVTKYDSYSDTTILIQNAIWNGNSSLLGNNGLQVINGSLVYPKFNFSTPGTIVSNPNFGLSSTRNYSNCFAILNGHGTGNFSPSTNYRTYTRYFETSTFSSNFIFRIYSPLASVINTNIVTPATTLVGNRIWLEVKAYNQSNKVTGWMSLASQYLSRGTLDGAGALLTNRAVIGTIDPHIVCKFTIGTTQVNKVVFRITAGPDWQHYITKLELSL